MRRDERNIDRLRELGWRVCVLWECEVKDSSDESVRQTVDELVDWLKGHVPMKFMPHARTQVSEESTDPHSPSL